MASDTKSGASGWRRALLAALVALIILALAVGWLIGTTSGARAGLAAVESLSRGTVRTDGIEGRLAGPLHMKRLVIEQSGSRATLTDIDLDWRPVALLQSKLHIEALHVGHLDMVGKDEKDPKPATLPENIALPFALQADNVQLGGGSFSRGPAKILALGPLALRIDFDGSRYRLHLTRLSIGSPDNRRFAADISGEATLSTARPYALEGRFISTSKATVQERAVGATGTIGIAGSLERLDAAIDLVLNEAQVRGNAILRPFSTSPLGQSQLSADQLDLSRFGAGLPQTALDIRLTTTNDGAGELTVRNTRAGTNDAGKLPLHALLVAFRQNEGVFAFDRIATQLGTATQTAGTVTGQGRYADNTLTLTLRTNALDLKRIDRRARSTRLSGEADLRNTGGKQEFRLVLSEPLQKRRVTLDVLGTLSDQELVIRRAGLQAGTGRISLAGHLALAGNQAFGAQGEVEQFRLRDLGNFPQLPDLDLNATFSLHGARQPALEADLTFRIADSRLAGHPLQGNGEAQLRGDRLRVPHFLLVSGVNRLNIEGQLSDDNTQLRFALHAPQLAQLGPNFGGALQASGTVSGTLAQPRIRAEWNASNARGPMRLQVDSMQGKADISIDRKRPFMLDTAVADLIARGLRHGDDQLSGLSAQLRFAPQPDAPLALAVRADGISLGALRAERFVATAKGMTARHAIDASIEEKDQFWALKVNGGLGRLTSAPRWQGTIDAFDASGKFKARLASPSRLLLSAERIQLDSFLWDTDSGRIAVEQFLRDTTGIVTRGRVERMQLAQLLQRANPQPNRQSVQTDLEFSGEWNMRIGDALSGTLAMRRERGDVTVLAASPITLGLRTLSANVTADSGYLAFQLLADGKRLGRIEANANTTLGNGDSQLAIAPGAPVTGSARIDMPSLAWIAPLLSPDMLVDGRLHGEMTLGGTAGQPRLAGHISGESLRLSLSDPGLDLRQGRLDSSFEGDHLLIRSLVFQGAEGRVALSGPIDFGEGTVAARLTLMAERFALLNRSDRRIVLSGSSELAWRDRSGNVSGNFTVDSGFIDLGSTDKPRLSDDVVVVGREKKAAGKSTLDVDIGIALGDGVILKGRGMDAVLAGQIRLVSKPGETLQAQGTLNVAKGTYSAYGRELAIEQGVLRFRGALNNPALDILAMRRGQEVEAGVSILGTALTPRVTLVSEPAVPDAEKLSWLVLGRGLASAGESDIGTLQSAAAALLSEGAKASVQSRIASAFGLDTFSVGTSQDSLQQRVVTLGKQISSRLYLSYQQGLETAGSVVQLRYVLSSKLSIEAAAGSRSALSLFYNIAFD